VGILGGGLGIFCMLELSGLVGSCVRTEPQTLMSHNGCSAPLILQQVHDPLFGQLVFKWVIFLHSTG
jgi:hypothetical protein